MALDRVGFSKNEWELIKRYYVAQKRAQKEGNNGKVFKVDKTKLYREVFNRPDMRGGSACSAARQILSRFNKLSKESRDKILEKMEMEVREDELLKIETATNIVMARVEGARDNIKGYVEGKIEGHEVGLNEVKQELKTIDVNTPQGRAKEKNWLALKLKFILDLYDPDDERRRHVPLGYAIKGLTDILQEPKNENHSQITIDNSVNELNVESALELLKKNKIKISSKALETIIVKGASKEEDLTKQLEQL